MARIETDPNYSSPTFSRATAATDLFKKEDVQNLASAMSTHDHGSTKGLAVSRIGVPLNQDLALGAGYKLQGNPITIQSSSASGATDVNIIPPSAGSALSEIMLFSTSTMTNTHRMRIYTSATDHAIVSEIVASGTYKPLSIFQNGAASMTFNADGTMTMSKNLVSSAAVNPNTILSTAWINAGTYLQTNNGTLYLVDSTMYIAGASGSIFTRSNGGLAVQTTAGVLTTLQCGSIIMASNTMGAVIVLPSGVGPRISCYDTGSGKFAGFGINSGEFTTILPGNWQFAWRVNNNSGTIVGFINYAGQLICGANFSPASSAANSASYAVSTLNAGGNNGQIIAFSHPTYACVDHAREANLPIDPITDATTKVLAVQPYSYPHINFESGNQTQLLAADGTVTTTPTLGFSARDVYAAIPEAAALDETGTPIGVDSYRLLCMLWSSVQEMQTRLQALEGVPVP